MRQRPPLDIGSWRLRCPLDRTPSQCRQPGREPVASSQQGCPLSGSRIQPLQAPGALPASTAAASARPGAIPIHVFRLRSIPSWVSPVSPVPSGRLSSIPSRLLFLPSASSSAFQASRFSDDHDDSGGAWHHDASSRSLAPSATNNPRTSSIPPADVVSARDLRGPRPLVAVVTHHYRRIVFSADSLLRFSRGVLLFSPARTNASLASVWNTSPRPLPLARPR